MKINFGKAPEKGRHRSIQVGDTKYVIENKSVRFGSLGRGSGRFVVSWGNAYSHGYFDYGDYYGTNTSRAKAWSEVKQFIKEREGL